MKGGAVITAGYSSAALCRQPWGLGGTNPGCVTAGSSAAPKQRLGGTGHPAESSIFIMAPLLMLDVHTFLYSYLIISIIKMIFVSPAHRGGEKDSDSESTRKGRAVPPQFFCQNLPQVPGSVSKHLHKDFIENIGSQSLPNCVFSLLLARVQENWRN